MSSISPDPRLDRAGPMASQVSLEALPLDARSADALRRGEQGQGAPQLEAAEVAYASDALVAQDLVDSGENVLNARAWDGIADGDRLLSGDTEFEAQLGTLELSQAADQAADAILGAFA
jgi:hypothetical protein